MYIQALDQLTIPALVGASRKAPVWPTLPGAISELLANLDDTDTADQLLKTAGVLALTAGFALELDSISPSDIVKAPIEDNLKNSNSIQLPNIIRQIVRDGPIALQVEILKLFTLYNLRFPPEHFPQLLNAAVKIPTLREALATLPGQRHKWLATLNPKWMTLELSINSASNIETLMAILETGTLKERVSALSQLRLQIPEQARQWLANSLDQNSAQDRQELIAVLQIGLSMDDADLLNSLLKDRSKSVQQLARQMLSCLAESSFAQRIMTYLDAIISIKQRSSKNKLIIEVPEVFDTAWGEAGISEQPPQGEGVKAFWLRQLVALTPLNWWTKRLNCNPEQALALCIKSDWHTPLTVGLVAAAITQNNNTWADAMLNTEAIKSESSHFAALLKIATPSIVESLLTSQLKANAKPEILFEIIHQAKQLSSWSINFADTLFNEMRERVHKFNYHATTQLQDLASHLPPAYLETALKSRDSAVNNPRLDEFFKIVRLRILIYQEITLTSCV